ncbi:MAG: DUF309 domain-containing protein [Leptolyngbya sp. SIO4C1]|nr:DUF309 domain-containing protein [Leptolyngbya sp. SIO4C1]
MSPAELWQGVDQFNRGDYYACHDTLEAIWMDAIAQQKPFYQGILQIAVGFYHLRNHNWRGAAILLGEGSHRLGPFEPAHSGIDVVDLVDQAQAWLMALQTAGPEGVQAVAAQLSSATEATTDVTAEPVNLPPPQIRASQPRPNQSTN